MNRGGLSLEQWLNLEGTRTFIETPRLTHEIVFLINKRITNSGSQYSNPKRSFVKRAEFQEKERTTWCEQRGEGSRRWEEPTPLEGVLPWRTDYPCLSGSRSFTRFQSSFFFQWRSTLYIRPLPLLNSRPVLKNGNKSVPSFLPSPFYIYLIFAFKYLIGK